MEEQVNQYIAHPPAGYSTSPWLYVDGGTVRYATSHDMAPASYVLNEEQYVFLHKSAGLGTPTPARPPVVGPWSGIYAGIDTNGQNYNTRDIIVDAGGSGLYKKLDGTLRVCQLRNNHVTLGIQNPMSYSRPRWKQQFIGPFYGQGEIFLHSRATDPYILGENRKPTWTWAPNFHPVFVDEDNNIVTGLSPVKNRWSASGQIDKTYGIPNVSRLNIVMNHDEQMGAWHTFRMEAPMRGIHMLYWDDEMVYRVVEPNPPAKWWGRPMSPGMRLDFYDYSLRNLECGAL